MRHHRVGKETYLLLVTARTRLTETRIARRDTQRVFVTLLPVVAYYPLVEHLRRVR